MIGFVILFVGCSRRCALERLAPTIEATVDELLDGVADAGGGDLRPLLTTPLPALVIADLLGVPRADRERFQGWSDQLAHVVFSAEGRGHRLRRRDHRGRALRQLLR